MTDYLIDTNILIYHTQGSQKTINFITSLVAQRSFYISILTKIEFLGWDKHTSDGFKKCKRLIDSAVIFPVDNDIANKAIDFKKEANVKLADAVIAATALLNNMKLATRNVDDFKMIKGLEVIDPFR